MSLFVTLAVETPLLRTAVESASETHVRIERQKMAPDGTVDVTIQASGGELPEFEAGLEADATVERWFTLGHSGTRRLYQVCLSETGRDHCTYHGWASEDAVFVSARPTEVGWHETLRFRNRIGLEGYVDFCADRDLSCSLLRVRDATDEGCGLKYGLTELQERTLAAALEHGYYAVPRGISLQELAELFGISHQALSERLRRGVGTLVENTVAATQAAHIDDQSLRLGTVFHPDPVVTPSR